MTTVHDPWFWQKFGAPPPDVLEPHYITSLPDGRTLALPIRRLADSENGLASFIANQASFAVLNSLVALLADRLRPHAPEIIVGLPTLGLTVAAAVAEALGHARYVAAGTSRKFWYDAAPSTSLRSVTTSAPRQLWLDQRLLPLLVGRRVALIDDVISTGASIRAGLALLDSIGVRPVAVGALMLQSSRWRADWPANLPYTHVFTSPLLQQTPAGWEPAETST